MELQTKQSISMKALKQEEGKNENFKKQYKGEI